MLWKQRAAEAIKQGYQKGNHWENLLRKHLEQHFPDKVTALGKDLEAYLIVQTARAFDVQEQMQAAGTDPAEAERMALKELLPPTEDEQEQAGPLQYEREGATTDMLEATRRHLLKLR
jgi:hypothetical protein